MIVRERLFVYLLAFLIDWKLVGWLVGWLVPSPTLCDFASGAVLGACVSTISFPFSAAAVQIQKVGKGEEE